MVTREYTINMHKRLHNIGFKYRAPRCLFSILSTIHIAILAVTPSPER